jgi:hypothetical protein
MEQLMPVVDLKNVDIYLEDGYSEAGAVNLMAGYVIGTTTIVVDGITGIIPVGSRFVLTGDPTDYVVVSTVETTGNTTSITFSPGLVEAAVDNQVFTVYGRFLQIRVGDGTLTWSEKKPREYKKDRGILYEVRNADEEPMDVTMQFMYEVLRASSGQPPTPSDVLKRRGAASTWLSTAADQCSPYCVNIRLDHSPAGCSSFEVERVVLPFFYYESMDHNPKEGMINVQGKCNAVEAIVTRLAA